MHRYTSSFWPCQIRHHPEPVPQSCSAQFVFACFEHTVQLLHQVLQQRYQHGVTANLVLLLSPNWAATKQRPNTSCAALQCRISAGSGRVCHQESFGRAASVGLGASFHSVQLLLHGRNKVSLSVMLARLHNVAGRPCISYVHSTDCRWLGTTGQPCNLTVCWISTLNATVKVHLSQTTLSACCLLVSP